MMPQTLWTRFHGSPNSHDVFCYKDVPFFARGLLLAAETVSPKFLIHADMARDGGAGLLRFI
jgi:hypothetical protein